jgi:hypothetical protein
MVMKPEDQNMMGNAQASQPRGGLLGLFDKAMKTNEETGLSPLQNFAAALDPLIMKDMRGGEGIRKQGVQRATSISKNKTVDMLRKQGRNDLADAVMNGTIAAKEAFGVMQNEKAADTAFGREKDLISFRAGLERQAASGNPNVQSSKMLPDDSGVVLTMKNGDIVVKTIGGKSGTGEILFGQAALDFANSAHDKYTSRQEGVNKARRTGTNVADIETGGQAASATQEGQVTGGKIGELKFELAEMQSSMPGLQTVVQKLSDLSDTATYTKLGVAADTLRKEFQLEPGAGAIDRDEYLAVVDNQVLPLLRQTFGAQFTVEEGKSLRATLGDPDKTPASKKRVLNAFIEQKERNILAKAEAINILNQPFKFNNVQDTIVSPTLNPVTAPSIINGYSVEEVID